MKNLFTLLVLAISFFGFAQNNTLCAGGNATGSTGSVSYSIGQIIYKNQVAPNYRYILEGLQQPYEFVSLSNDTFSDIGLTLVAYPNPTVSSIKLNVNNYDYKNSFFEIIDINGKIIQNKVEIKSTETLIDLSQNPVGIYILSLTKNNLQVKILKIIKN